MSEENENNILIIVAARLARKECLTRLHELCDLEQRVVSTRSVRDAVEHAEDTIVRECIKVVRGHDMLAKKLRDAESEVARLNEQVQGLKDRLQMAGELSDVAARLHVKAEEMLRTLAAENAVMLRLLTVISENHVEYFSEGEDGMFAGVPLDYVSEINMYVSRDVEAENPFPVTDAILNEVRAQAVEGFEKYCIHLAECSGDKRWIGAGRNAAFYANSIRAGEVQP